MTKRVLLIDIDDTICNSSEAYEIALLKCYEFLNKKYPLIDKKLFLEIYKKARGEIHLELNGNASMHNRFLYFQRMFEIFGLTLQSETLDEITEIFWDETYKNLKLYSKVKETLRIIKENHLRIGIVSDLVAHIQIKKLKKLGISKYVDFIITSEEAGKEKPHPSIFLLALEKADCRPNEAIMVGDSIEKDIIGAKHLGITSILISNNTEKRDKVDFVINNFKEIIEILGITQKKLITKQVIVFDLMGALFTEGHIISKMLLPLLTKKKIKIDYKKLKESYIEYTLGKITQKEFWKIIPQKFEKEFLDSMKLDKDVLRVIEYLKKRGYLLGILSNIPKEWGNYLIVKFGLNKYFSTIIFSGEYGTRKPNEKLYEIFVEIAKVKPENCYFIDDNLINLKEARFLLMKTIWIKKEEQEILFIPDFRITKINELKNIL
jgi:putative hydrolase of the HAD superfamily